MKFVVQVLLLLILTYGEASSQILKGKVTNQSGEPIQYATIYIQELKQGTTANIKGDYEIRLPAGKYTVIYESLGFQPVFVTTTIVDKLITRDVILPLQYYEIPEVRISATGEDPAYIVMRKAIGMAPYYLNDVSYYKAEVYLKGNLVIKRIPKILQKSLKMESNGNSTTVSGGGKPKPEEKVMKEGDSYLMESNNEMEFTAPDKYFQRVISYNSTFPEQGNDISPMDYIQASFYQPLIGGFAISPLSPSAFSHYKFKYLGASLQGNVTINKIQVIPRRKSQQLFEGTIYIIEDLWCLHSVDLTNENLIGKMHIQQLYIPVQDDIWMPVSHKFEINIGIIGFKADAGYGSSVKYLEVKPNTSLQKPGTVTVDYSGIRKPSAKQSDSIPESKTKKQIDKILEKDKMSNRDMIRMAKLMEKESEKNTPDSSKKSLEIKDHTTQIIEKDATRKDSSYWARIRPIPLSDIEARSLRVNDSIKAGSLRKEVKNDTILTPAKKEKSKFFTVAQHIVSGHTWADTTGFSFTNEGLLGLKNLSFNTVDGFVYSLDFSFRKSWKKNKSLYVSPEVMYAFSRNQLMWRLTSFYKFNGMNQSQLFLSTGIISRDINNAGGINVFLNSVSSLFFKENFLKLYESRYLNLGFRREIINGLEIILSTNFENRRVLENTTGFSLFKSSRTYSDNIPVNSYLLPGSNPVNALRDQKNININAVFTYTPYQKYRISNGNKIPAGSDWPVFNLEWKHGITDVTGSTGGTKQFDMLKFEVSKTQKMGAFSEFKWRIRTGGFPDNRNVTFYDFFHFNSQPIPVLINNYQDAFMLPDYYSLSTPEFFGEAHVKYTTPYLLLKLLPGLSNTLMLENLSLSYLGSRYHTNYTEIGYSISQILFIGELGIYAGFDDLKFRSVGGKLVLRFK